MTKEHKIMKVHNKALIIATVPSMIGQFNLDNIQILMNLGYEVQVACNFEDRSVWTKERVEEFQRQLQSLGIQSFQIDFARSPKNISKLTASYHEIEHLLFHEKYSLVHVHTPVAATELRLAAKSYNDAVERRKREGKKALQKLKVIYTAHGFHFYDGAPLKDWLLFYPVERVLSKYTDVLITINKEDYKRAKSDFHAKKTVYIPGVGIDTEKFSNTVVDRNAKRLEMGISEDAFLLLSVGELSERKNHRLVIEALHELNDPRIYYFIAGIGHLCDEYKELIKQYGLEGKVKLLGYRDDVAELYKIADCFIFPSVQEGLPVALMEAMASGLPVIASRIRGNVDLVGEKNGVLFSLESKEEVKEDIRNIKEDKDTRLRMGQYNKTHMEMFDSKNIDIAIRKVYS